MVRFHAPARLSPLDQKAISLTISAPYPQDITGTLRLEFRPTTSIPGDDPAIQFINGQREISFVVPAGTLEARFPCPDCESHSSLAEVPFQTGTVAGSFIFRTTLQMGAIQSQAGITLSVSKERPVISSVHIDNTNGPLATFTLFSNTRDMGQLTMRFDTTPPVRLSCGATSGCFASGSSVFIDVSAEFASWFALNTELGSLSNLRLPFSIQGTVRGTVFINLRNSAGLSNTVSFPLP
jgi:hypothetical protein